MSLRADHRRLRAIASPLTLAAAALATPSGATAQSIAEYSRAQRAVLEATLARQTAAAAAVAASSAVPPVAAAPAPAPSPPVPATASPPQGPVDTPLVPHLGVNGVFASTSRLLAEVVVDGIAFVLAVGEVVPRTDWRVSAVTPDRVVLRRVATAGVARNARGDAGTAGDSRVFELGGSR